MVERSHPEHCDSTLLNKRIVRVYFLKGIKKYNVSRGVMVLIAIVVYEIFMDNVNK